LFNIGGSRHDRDVSGLGKDYADALAYFQPIFKGRTIIPQGSTNDSPVGLKPSQAKSPGVRGSIEGVPSVDPQLDRCAALFGQARLTCYEALDRTLMTRSCRWVPYLFSNAAHIVGPKVTRWQYDQFSDATAFARVAASSQAPGLPSRACDARGRRGPFHGFRTTSSSTMPESGCGRCR